MPDADGVGAVVNAERAERARHALTIFSEGSHGYEIAVGPRVGTMDEQAQLARDVLSLAADLAASQQALTLIAADVHLILNDHYSGRPQERQAAMPAYARLTNIFEYEDEAHDPQIRDVNDIIAAALAGEAAGQETSE